MDVRRRRGRGLLPVAARRSDDRLAGPLLAGLCLVGLGLAALAVGGRVAGAGVPVGTTGLSFASDRAEASHRIGATKPRGAPNSAAARAPAAATLWVDDDPGCGGNAPCFASIQMAARAAAAGDTVRIRPGSYAESVVLTQTLALVGPRSPQGTPNPTLDAVWRSAGPGQPALRVPMPLSGAPRVADVALLDSSVSVSGTSFEMNGVLLSGAAGSGLSVAGAATVTLRSVAVLNAGDVGLDLRDIGAVTVASSTVSGNRVGIRIAETNPGGASLLLGGSPERANDLAGNDDAALVLENASGTSVSTSPVAAEYNRWGSGYPAQVEAWVRHRPDDSRLGVVDYWPIQDSPVGVSLDASPAELVGGAGTQAALTGTITTAGGAAPAADTVAAFAADAGTVTPQRRALEAEADGVTRGPGWTTLQDSAFGPSSGGRYIRAGAGATLSWPLDTPAGILRFGQQAVGAGAFTLQVEGGPTQTVNTRATEKRWASWPLPVVPGAGPRGYTVTVTSGTVAIDRVAGGATPSSAGAMAVFGAFMPPNALGAVPVRAWLETPDGAVSAERAIGVIPGPPAHVELTPASSQVQVGGITTTLAITVLDAWDRPVADGTVAQLAAARGSVQPDHALVVGGRGQATYTSPVSPGPDPITVTAGDVTEVLAMDVVPGPPASVTLTPAKSSLFANSRDSTALQAVVRDAFGHPVADGTTVMLTTTLGSLDELELLTSAGNASTVLTAGNVAGGAALEAVAGQATGTAAVTLRASDLWVTKAAEPQSVVVPDEAVTYTLAFGNDGPGPVFDAQVVDPLPDGLVQPVISAAGPPLERLTGTDLAWRVPRIGAGASGVITVVLTVDPRRPWGQRETVRNQVSILAPSAAEAAPGNNQGAADTVVVPGAAFTLTLTAPETLIVGGTTADITARVTDRFGNPAADGTGVFFSTDLGAVSPETDQTQNGVAVTTLTSPNQTGSATLRALTVEGRGGTKRVRFVPGPASQLDLVAVSERLAVGGDTTLITATLTDAFDNGIAGAEVDFQTNLGALNPVSRVTDARGVATTTLISGVRPGRAQVLATVADLEGRLEIPFEPGGVDALALTVEPRQAGPGVVQVGRARVTDEFGNGVPGVSVSFDATLGRPEPPVARTGLDGVVATTIEANAVGLGTLRATAGSLQAEAPYARVPARLFLPFAETRRRAAVSVLDALTVQAVSLDASGPGPTGGSRIAGDGETAINLVLPRFLTVSGVEEEIGAQVWIDDRPAPDGTRVTFSGSLGLTFDPIGAPTQGGVAVTTVRPGTEAGYARIDAAALGDRGDAVMWVRPAPVARLAGLTAAPRSAAPGEQIRITADLTDAWGNPAEGDVVRWTAEGGTIEPRDGRVEHGSVSAWFRMGRDGPPTVSILAGSVFGQINLGRLPRPAARPGPIYLPDLRLSAATGCWNVLDNASFERDTDADRVPDGWEVDGAVLPTALDGINGGTALGLVVPASGHTWLRQSVRAPEGADGARLRLWLKAAPSQPAADLRVSVRGFVSIGGSRIEAPILVETLTPGEDWELHVLPLPVAPEGPATVELSPRGAPDSTVALDGLSLEVCR